MSLSIRNFWTTRFQKPRYLLVQFSPHWILVVFWWYFCGDMCQHHGHPGCRLRGRSRLRFHNMPVALAGNYLVFSSSLPSSCVTWHANFMKPQGHRRFVFFGMSKSLSRCVVARGFDYLVPLLPTMLKYNITRAAFITTISGINNIRCCPEVRCLLVYN